MAHGITCKEPEIAQPAISGRFSPSRGEFVQALQAICVALVLQYRWNRVETGGRIGIIFTRLSLVSHGFHKGCHRNISSLFYSKVPVQHTAYRHYLAHSFNTLVTVRLTDFYRTDRYQNTRKTRIFYTLFYSILML